jgi:hypothetical protein
MVIIGTSKNLFITLSTFAQGPLGQTKYFGGLNLPPSFILVICEGQVEFSVQTGLVGRPAVYLFCRQAKNYLCHWKRFTSVFIAAKKILYRFVIC